MKNGRNRHKQSRRSWITSALPAWMSGSDLSSFASSCTEEASAIWRIYTSNTSRDSRSGRTVEEENNRRISCRCKCGIRGQKSAEHIRDQAFVAGPAGPEESRTRR